MTQSAPARPRRRWIVVTASVVGGLVVLGVVAEFALRGVIDDRLETTAASLPAGVTMTRDSTPALWQVATGQAAVRLDVSSEALTETARSAADLPGLQVASGADGLVAQVPLSLAGQEQTVDVLLSVTAEDGKAMLRADTVQFAGLSLPVATVAEQLGNDQLDRLVDGVAYPEEENGVVISSAQTTGDGLELGAEVPMWG
ncbi:hypothetical protein AB1046_23355 [Promicromonospora sp. Populi]|uniref:hypothetical protein n=1 Tax=Promicromonospora sp. Populi TaxID=3239420 RepID=UPI0034E2C989